MNKYRIKHKLQGKDQQEKIISSILKEWTLCLVLKMSQRKVGSLLQWSIYLLGHKRNQKINKCNISNPRNTENIYKNCWVLTLKRIKLKSWNRIETIISILEMVEAKKRIIFKLCWNQSKFYQELVTIMVLIDILILKDK